MWRITKIKEKRYFVGSDEDDTSLFVCNNEQKAIALLKAIDIGTDEEVSWDIEGEGE